VLTASVLWGTTGTAATFAPAVGPLAVGAAAMGLGGLLQALYAVRPMTRERAALHAQRRLVLLGAAAVTAYPLAFYTSMRLAGVAVGTVVSIGSAPLASALAERVLDRQRLTARWTAGAAPGLAGIVLLCLAEATRPHPGRPDAWPTMAGIGLGLAAGATYASYSWAAHRLIGRGVAPRAAMGAVFGLGALLLLPVLLATGAPLATSWPDAAVGAYLALVPMFTGYVLFGRALAHVPASTATTLSLLEPAVATILAVTVVDERLPATGWAGLILIVGCLAVITAPARLPRSCALPQADRGDRVPGVFGDEIHVDRRARHQPGRRGGDDLGLRVSNVAGDIYPWHAGGAARVRRDPGGDHLPAEAHLDRGEAERREQVRVGHEPRRHDQRVQGHAGTVGEPDSGQAAGGGLDPRDEAVDDRDAERAELAGLLGGERRGGVPQHGHVGGELAEQQRLVHGARPGGEDPDALVADFPPVAVRAVQDVDAPPLGQAGDVGELIVQPGRDEQPPRGYRPAAGLGPEQLAVPA
jgi:drug/metabolite transporter, DME family